MRWLALLAIAACDGGNPYVEAAEKDSGLVCEETARCDRIVRVDCAIEFAPHNPIYFLVEGSAYLITVCGGVCQLHPDPKHPEWCRACPPPGWTCEF